MLAVNWGGFLAGWRVGGRLGAVMLRAIAGGWEQLCSGRVWEARSSYAI